MSMLFVTTLTSVARFTGSNFIFVVDPSAEALGYFQTSASRTKSARFN